MSSNLKTLNVRSKIWIEDEDGNIVFGAGRLRILKAVAEHGSILAAAKELHMSYRAVWGKIKTTEERLGQPLLKKRTGGSRGGGSELTALGKALVDQYEYFQSLTQTTANTFFQGLFGERSGVLSAPQPKSGHSPVEDP